MTVTRGGQKASPDPNHTKTVDAFSETQGPRTQAPAPRREIRLGPGSSSCPEGSWRAGPPALSRAASRLPLQAVHLGNASLQEAALSISASLP